MVNSTSYAFVESIPESVWVLFVAALICAAVCLYAWWAWDLFRAISNRTRPGQPSANKGIDKKLVESLPKFTYDSGNQYKGRKLSSSDCAICLEEYAGRDEVRVLPQCGHGFHVACVDKWLGSHSSCPSCRRILVISICKKCGEFPAVSAGKVSIVGENEGRQHDDRCRNSSV